MAKSEATVVASALAAIDVQIADLQRSRMIIVSAIEDARMLEGPTAPKAKRGRKRRGAPTGGDVAGQEVGL